MESVISDMTLNAGRRPAALADMDALRNIRASGLLHYMLRHNIPTTPGVLEVEAAGDAVYVYYFAGEIETGDYAALHG